MFKQLSEVKFKKRAKQVELCGSKYFSIIDGLLFRRYSESDLFVVPESMVNSIIRLSHDDLGHVGTEKIIRSILNHYWFSCLKLKVQQYI